MNGIFGGLGGIWLLVVAFLAIVFIFSPLLCYIELTKIRELLKEIRDKKSKK